METNRLHDEPLRIAWVHEIQWRSNTMKSIISPIILYFIHLTDLEIGTDVYVSDNLNVDNSYWNLSGSSYEW